MSDKTSQDLIAESSKTDFNVLLTAKEQAKAAVIEDPSPNNVLALERTTKMFENYIEKDKKSRDGAENQPEFVETKKAIEVHRYLESAGWKISKSQFYAHIDEGKLKKNKEGLFTKRVVLKYADIFLPRVSSGKKVAEQDLDLQREKTEIEISLKRTQDETARFKLDIEKGKYIPREHLETEMAARAAALEAGLKHLIQSRANEWVTIVNGDLKNTKVLIDTILTSLDEHLNNYATLDEFQVIIMPNESTIAT